MEIKLRKDIEEKLIHSMQRYLSEEFGGEVGSLKAKLALKFCLQEVGPCIYNQAIADAQAYMQERTADMENTCFAQEFTYWRKK